MKRLKDIGEDALVGRLLRGFPPGDLVVGPGDDCAVAAGSGGMVRLLKTDALVERVHFSPDASPAKVGWKAAARVISDFAAMGGRPAYLMITVALPSDREVSWVEKLYGGFRRCLETHGGVLAGGETTSVPDGSAVVISVSGEGEAPKRACVTRSGGRTGDVLAVTGRLGGSIGGRHLSFHPRLAEGEALAGGGASAMMDLSDGLAKDLPRMAKASGCGFELVAECVPRHRGCSVEAALGDGEDYELLVAVPPKKWTALVQGWPDDFAPLTAVGRLVAEGGALEGGWEHFAK